MTTGEKPPAAAGVFTDSAGRTYIPRVTCRVIQRWEQATKRGMFEAVFDVLEESMDSGTLRVTEKTLYKLSKGLFGNMSNLLFLLYEACRPAADVPAKATVTDPNTSILREVSVSYDDFLDAITPQQMLPAVMSAVSALFEFFPDKESLGAAARPTEPGTAEAAKDLLGKMPLRPPPSQE